MTRRAPARLQRCRFAAAPAARWALLASLLLLAAGCRDETGPPGASPGDVAGVDAPGDATSVGPDADAAPADTPAEDTAADDAPAADAPADAGPVSCDDKAARCAAEADFGALFTKTNGRADGTLLALVRPVDQQCAWPNGTHVTVQLSMLGVVQRLSVSVEDIAIATASKPLLGPPWAEGWHENQDIDYRTDLGLHSTDFSPATADEAVAFLCEHLALDAPVSVFAYSDGSKPSSAHQIHRNDNYPDGAVVANPTSDNPTYLLFRYSNQVF